MTTSQQHSKAKILDGNKVSQALIDCVRESIEAHVAAGGRRPGLAVVLVGSDPASSIYVRAKRRDCERAGIIARDFDLYESTSEKDLLDLIDRLNEDPEVDGVLVQLPLPHHINEASVTNRIRADKDVDGFHAFMALELLLTGSTVTVSHRFTRNLEEHVRSAELLISAIGKQGIVNSDWIRPGAIVVDVGINRMPDGKIVGDIDFERAAERAGWISPVPGGVGPMTRATLMLNTAEAAGLEVSMPFKAQPRG